MLEADLSADFVKNIVADKKPFSKPTENKVILLRFYT